MGYAENRSNWTAASVYRHPSGSVQGFGGTSERQATETTFRFAATDHDVFFNGHGPTREYNMTLPGGTGYQQGQTNAEALVNIQGGDDVMPPLPTEATICRIANRVSGLYLAPSNNSPASGANVCQVRGAANNTGQQWKVSPVDIRVGGDFSYYRIDNAKTPAVRLSVDRWTIDDAANVYCSTDNFDINQQWTIEYAGDGWFYLRNRQSGHYLQVAKATTAAAYRSNNRNINQGVFTGEPNQQWRFLPADVKYDADAPAPPTALTATPHNASIHLSWQAPADDDATSYTILRSTDQAEWHVINQGIATCAYIDNTALPETTYYYKVRTRDASLNLSEPSAVVSAATTETPACIAHIACDSLTDSSVNANHAAILGTPTLAEGHIGQALKLDGSKQFIQLPATIACSRELTVAAWFYWTGGSRWQRLFDFGTDTDHYFFVSPSNGSTSRLRLAIKSGTTEHNGQQAASLNATERPADFRPIFNYVGRSQFRDDPMLNASVDDIRIYNYPLSEDELTRLINGEALGIGDSSPATHTATSAKGDTDDTPTYNLDGTPAQDSPRRHQIHVSRGRKAVTL